MLATEVQTRPLYLISYQRALLRIFGHPCRPFFQSLDSERIVGACQARDVASKGWLRSIRPFSRDRFVDPGRYDARKPDQLPLQTRGTLYF
jgi:hypothetical protein